MCGRYTLHQDHETIAKRYNLATVPNNLPESYNVAPGQFMPVIVQEDGKNKLEVMKWGLLPRWAKDTKIGYKLINARDDAVFVKPMWRTLVQKQRALIPANGFYEWKRLDDGKQPFYISPKLVDLFSFAGVWETWKDHDGNEWKTYTIITTEPNKEMVDVHNRMPVILHQEDEASWLEPTHSTRDSLEPLLRPYEDNGLDLHEVSRDVNIVRNNDKNLIFPINSQ